MASIYESFSIQRVWTKGPLTLTACFSDCSRKGTFFYLEFNRHCIHDSRKHIGDILELFVVIRKLNIKFLNVFLDIGKLCECLNNRNCSENIRKCD